MIQVITKMRVALVNTKFALANGVAVLEDDVPGSSSHSGQNEQKFSLTCWSKVEININPSKKAYVSKENPDMSQGLA